MSARTRKQKPWIFFIVGTIGVLCITCISFFVVHPSIPGRIGVAIVGDPTVVFSYDPVRKIITAVGIPSDVYVDAVRGYGAYPLSSLWKLDSMDKRQGVLYTETLEEMIGFPIRFFINPSNQVKEPHTIDTRIQESLSFISCLQILFQRTRTNIPPWLLFDLTRAYQGMSAPDITTYDLTNQAVYYKTVLADGTEVKKIDAGKLSFLMGTHAEDAQIRKENLRIAVNNTTASPGLAQKVTRVIETAGFHVVTIGNDETIQPGRCILQTKKEIQNDISIQTLEWLYGCLIETANVDMQEDITFIIGTEFEKRFLPF